MLFLRIRADIFQEGRFARTCFARQEYGLTGILNAQEINGFPEDTGEAVKEKEILLILQRVAQYLIFFTEFLPF